MMDLPLAGGGRLPVVGLGLWKVADAEYHGREFTPVAYEIAKAKTDQAGRL